MERLSRRSFVKIAGAATGAAAFTGAPSLARAADSGAEQVEPTSRVPSEPVVAYVRDAARGEVTIVSGTCETTYHDAALVKRLLRAAARHERGVS